MITLITGGVKSGKTTFALKLGETYQKKLYIATAEPFDEEMERKIEKHQQERDGSWTTAEEPTEIFNAVQKGAEFEYTVLDCITVWMNNLFYHKKDIGIYTERFIGALKNINFNLTIVTNETGLGVIPADKLSRDYTNMLGITNQKIAKVADQTIFMVSGLPIYIKNKGDLWKNF